MSMDLLNGRLQKLVVTSQRINLFSLKLEVDYIKDLVFDGIVELEFNTCE